MPAKPEKRILVTFDVDGTLLTSGSNVAHKQALDAALANVWGTKGTIEDLQGKHRGMTDQLIMADVLRLHGYSEEDIWQKMPEAVEAAVEAIEGNMDSYDPDLLPGIPAFPEALAREGVCVGLVTGNLEPICWLKMKKARLDHCFIAGGFGSDHTDRAELIKICMRRAADKVLAPGETFTDCYHIGDAPSDVIASHAAQVKCINVLTGKFTPEQLKLENPWVQVQDLGDVDALVHMVLSGKLPL